MYLIYSVIFSWAIVACLFILSLVLTNINKLGRLRIILKNKNIIYYCLAFLIIQAIISWFCVWVLDIKPENLYISFFDTHFFIFSILLLHLDLNIYKVEVYNRYIKMRTSGIYRYYLSKI